MKIFLSMFFLVRERCCSELQAYIQAVTVYSEVEVDGAEKQQLVLFGSRLRNLGKSDFLEGTIFGTNCVFHHIGYAEVVFGRQKNKIRRKKTLIKSDRLPLPLSDFSVDLRRNEIIPC